MANRADPGFVSFGRYLKAIREKQGVELESVAEAICVSARQLRWLEAEDHEKMPGEVYVKGILRAYANELGVDPDDILQRYLLHRQVYEDALKKERQALSAGKKSFLRGVFALAVLGFIMAASLYAYNSLQGRNSNGLSSNPPDESRVSGNRKIDRGNGCVPVMEKSNDPDPFADTACKDFQRLTIDAVSEVTINVQIDDQPYTKYRLDPNDHMELAARNRFHLLISDAAGVCLKLNNKPLNLDSESGRSIDISLPEENGFFR
jgi:cytoskeletal protein RodZ